MDETEKYISQFPAYELIERIVKFRVMENQNRETKKAESLATNSIGQRPMKRHTPANPKPQRGVINPNINH